MLERRIAGLAIVVVAASVAVTLGASPENVLQAEPSSTATSSSPGLHLPPKPRYPVLDSTLNALVEQLNSVSAQAIAQDAPLSIGDAVAVTVRAFDEVSLIVEYLEAAGVSPANAGKDYVEAYVPVTMLGMLSELDGVSRVETIIPPQPAVTSQGAGVHNSPAWNSMGLTGQGIKVGIIDGGFEGYAGLMGGELPPTVTARCYTAVGAFSSNIADCENGSVHGTGVAETIVDVAPDVQLYIANVLSWGDAQSSALWMADQGVKVINMSLIWIWDGPGDGSIHFSNSPMRFVDQAIARGITWINAAGNEGQSTWFGSFRDTDGDGWHEVDAGGVEVYVVQLQRGRLSTFQLRWNDDWGHAAKDIDVGLFLGQNLVAVSENPQSGSPGQYPIEVVSYVPESSGSNYLAVFRFSGGVPSWIQLSAFTGETLNPRTGGYSISNPAESANPGMLAVGASRWSSPNSIEPFSSRGPTPDGRVKPDVVGADGGTTATYPSGFLGTSQAAPHVAGIAALVLQRFPQFSPQQVTSYIKSNALPRGATPNNTWGYGLAQLPPMAPLPPRNPTAVRGDREALVTWEPPESDGGSPITEYLVLSVPGNLQATVGGSINEAVLSWLTNGIPYSFYVLATNSVGSSDLSAPSARDFLFDAAGLGVGKCGERRAIG